MENYEILKLACEYLTNGNIESSKDLLKEKYPFEHIVYKKRSYSTAKMMKIFMRDCFIDRYSGRKLVNPGALRVLSEEFPQEVPYQAHGKLDCCHIAYWELMPTIDHVLPIARGGDNNDDNLVTTSMSMNLSKSSFTLDQLQWKLYPAYTDENWDGLTNWFINYVDKNPSLLDIAYIKNWYKVARRYFI